MKRTWSNTQFVEDIVEQEQRKKTPRVSEDISKPNSSSSKENTEFSQGIEIIGQKYDFGFVTSGDYLEICKNYDHIHKKRNIYLSDLLFECLKSSKVQITSLKNNLTLAPNETNQKSKRFLIIEPKIALNKELLKYHGKEYILFMEKIEEKISKAQNPSESSSTLIKAQPDFKKLLSKSEIETLNTFGLVDDADIFQNFFTYSKFVCGATLSAIRTLLGEEKNINLDIAFNPEGGRHHAFKSKAAGYCYLNDIVLVVMEAQEILKRDKKRHNIVIIDTDVHHGNATQESLFFTPNVLKLSFHQFGKGLYPPENIESGNLQQIGKGYGKNWNLNVPLKPGASDSTFLHVFDQIVPKILSQIDPDLVIWVCGADAAAGDPIGNFNLSINCYNQMATTILKGCERKDAKIRRKLLILGGGGYNPFNFAKIFTSIVGKCLSSEKLEKNCFDLEIPETCEYFKEFTQGHDGNLNVRLEYEVSNSKFTKDLNEKQELDQIVATADKILSELKKK